MLYLYDWHSNSCQLPAIREASRWERYKLVATNCQWKDSLMFELPAIDERIAMIAPGFRAISVLVDATGASQGELDPDILAKACAFVTNAGPGWAEASANAPGSR